MSQIPNTSVMSNDNGDGDGEGDDYDGEDQLFMQFNGNNLKPDHGF